MAEKNGGGSPSKPASSAASPSVTIRSPQELLAAVAVGLIAFFATDGHVVVRAVLAALALLALLLATVGLEVLQDYQKQSKQPKANKFDIVVRKIDLPAAPPGGVFAAAAAMEKHLQGFALSAKPDVKPVENGFTVLCGNQRLRARVAAGTAFGWQVGEKGWLEGRENWMAAVRAAPRGAPRRRVNWMGVCELAASAPPTAEAAAPDGSVEALEVGRAVRLQNLASKPELNGKPGVVAVKANENGRYGVRVDGVKEPMSIHGRNLAPMGKFDRVGLSVRRAQLGRATRPRNSAAQFGRAIRPRNSAAQFCARLAQCSDGSSTHRRRYRQFKQAVYFLEKDWQKVQVAYKERGGNPLKHFGFLLLGVISAILSLCWLIHIVLYIFIRQPAPASQFLNEYFMLLDNALPLLGTATYAIFAFYLLFCVLKGNLKFGLRFFLIPIHPMRVGNTMMNSFLFNVLLLLLCAVSAVQFCATAFATYARLTAVDMLFGVQVRNLIFLQYFFRHDVFIYLIVGVMAMTGLYLGVFPTDKRALDDADDDAPPM